MVFCQQYLALRSGRGGGNRWAGRLGCTGQEVPRRGASELNLTIQRAASRSPRRLRASFSTLTIVSLHHPLLLPPNNPSRPVHPRRLRRHRHSISPTRSRSFSPPLSLPRGRSGASPALTQICPRTSILPLTFTFPTPPNIPHSSPPPRALLRPPLGIFPAPSDHFSASQLPSLIQNRR